MNKKRKKARTLALLMAMAVGLASPPTAAAQHEGGGLFGRGHNDRTSSGEVNGSGVLNQGFGGTTGGLLNQGFGGTQGGLGNQNFGGTHGGITNQGFDVTIGSGLFVLVAAGAGYASLKKRNKKQNKKNKQN